MMNNLTHYRCVDSSKRSKSEDALFFIEIQMQIIALEADGMLSLVRPLCTRRIVSQRLQTFSTNIVINAFINVYYYILNVY